MGYSARFDISWIQWVMTTDDIASLPEPYLSNVEAATFEAPCAERLLGLVTAAKVQEGRKANFAAVSTKNALKASFRGVDRIVENALAGKLSGARPNLG